MEDHHGTGRAGRKDEVSSCDK